MRKLLLVLSVLLTVFSGALLAAELVEELQPAAWYDASQPASLMQKNGRVSKWRDRSGHNHTLTVPAGFTGPVLQEKAIGGKAALQFNGKTDCLAADFVPAAGNQPRTTFAVVRPISQAGRNHLYLYGNPSDGNCYGLGYEGGRFQMIYWNSFNVTNQTLGIQPIVLTQQYDGTTDTLASNLGPAFSGSPNPGQTGTQYPLHVGTRIAPAEFYRGTMAELIFFDRLLSPEETEAVKHHLMKKWSISEKMSNTNNLPLDAVLYGSTPEQIVHWWGKRRGLMRSPRDVGMIEDEVFRVQAKPVLEAYLKECTDPQERLAVAMRLTELGSAAGFEILLDALDNEPNPAHRASEIQVYINPGIADHILTLLGSTGQYDANGTEALRKNVTSRWRRQLAENPQKLFARLYPRPLTNGIQHLRIGNLRLHRQMDDMGFFYYLAGSNLYALGTMDGRYPALGRTLGTQSGFWSQPYKLLEKIEFHLKNERQQDFALDDCSDYTSTMATVNFHFEKDGLLIDRCDYIIENQTAFVCEITIANPGSTARSVQLSAEAFVDLRPGNRMRLGNDVDQLSYQPNGTLQAFDPALKYALNWGADRQADSRNIIDNSGLTNYRIELAPGARDTISFVLSGARTVREAAVLWQQVAQNRETLKIERQAAYDEIFSGQVCFHSSNPDLDAAFACAKVNLHMLKNNGNNYFPHAYYFGGIPDYPEMFGTDSCFSTPGILAANQQNMARNILDNFRRCTELQKGRVPHEVLPTNQITAAGNLQETPQWIMAIGQYVDWTGDLDFAAKCYDLAKAGLERTVASCGNDGKLYPIGWSLGEESGLSNRNIDSVCFFYVALNYMEKLGRALGKNHDADTYKSMSQAIRKDFRADWWDDSTGMWANALAGTEKKMYGYINATFPMNVGLADPDDAKRALDLLRKNCVNFWMWDKPRDNFNTCAFHNSHFGMGAFRYNDVPFAMKRMKLNANIITMDGLGAFENTNPVGDDIYQLWSIACVMELYIKGLAGISPDLLNRTIFWNPHHTEELDYYQVQNLQCGENVLTFDYQADGSWKVMFVQGSRPLHFEITLPDGHVETFDLSAGQEKEGM